MARKVKDKALDSREARSKLKRDRSRTSGVSIVV